MDKREIILKPYIFKMNEREIVSEDGALDAMDEYMKETGLELLEFVARNMQGHCVHPDGTVEFKYKGEWLTKEKFFECFL